MAMRETLRKITISLSAELVEFADDRARELQTSRSQVIGLALTAAKTREEEQSAAAGYRFYGDEASEFAEATRKAGAEAWTEVWLSGSPGSDERAQNGGQAR